MNHFHRVDGELWCEDVPLRRIAEDVGTPTYVYSAATLTRHYQVFDEAWAEADHLVCFAVKACSNIAILNLLAGLGSGFDIVSGGELRRVLAAGGDPGKVVFSGVGKTEAELEQALEAGILCFNVESEAELDQLDAVARRLGRRAPISLRVNPDVDAQTHPYISTGLRNNKFGVSHSQALRIYEHAASLEGLQILGLDCHIGSQLSDVEPMAAALRRLLDLLDQLERAGIQVHHLDLGGGLGITYDRETPPSPAAYARRLLSELGDRKVKIVLEPGRVIAGNAGVLLMKVLLTKDNDGKHFVVVDAGMNDAIRPALYGAWHGLETVGPPASTAARVDVVGPVCESGDFFARDREVPLVAAGDLVALMSAGAYGFTMSSNYNSRPRAAEVLVEGDRFHVIRDRERIEDLLRGERLPPR